MKPRHLMLLGALLGTACTQPGPPNSAPVARLRTPAIADARRPVVLDARASTDGDGAIAAYTYAFGDGTPAVERTDAQVDHVFPGAGRFTLELTVRDDQGAQASLTRELELVDRFTPPYCSNAEPCETNQQCVSTDAGSVCYVDGP